MYAQASADVYTQIHVHTAAYTHVPTGAMYTQVPTGAHMHAGAHTQVHTGVHTHRHTYTQTHMHPSAHRCAYTQVPQAHVYMLILLHTLTYTHAHTVFRCSRSLRLP